MLKPDNAYEERLTSARKDFTEGKELKELLSLGTDAKFLELFLIQFCAAQVAMVKPISQYLRRAAEKCQALGFKKLAESFFQHSKEEGGHEKWAHEDTQRLVKFWNDRRKPAVTAESFLNHGDNPVVRQYHQLHEEVVSGSKPYGILAIANEIERITVQFEPRMLLNSAIKVDPKVVLNLSFVKNHVKADEHHDKENIEMIREFLSEHPSAEDDLVGVGEKTLAIYYAFIADCAARAKALHRELKAVPR
jgi:hypothetical protein